MQLSIDISAVKGFLAPEEGEALYSQAAACTKLGPVLEIGSYCGKSTIYLGQACQENNSVLYALDHHRGSEEHQPGEFFHDASLFDQQAQQFDSFGEFRRNIQLAGLNDTVIPVVASSELASKYWNTALGMVFIDGGHSLDAALTDYRCWERHLVRGGVLAIHDIFADPYSGGHAPYAVYQLALASGLYEPLAQVNTLALLRRL